MLPDSRRELKLALLLFATAAVIVAAHPSSFAAQILHHRLGASAVHLGMLFAFAGLGGLATVPAAIWVDRRGPHPLMAIGAAVTAFGALALILATNMFTASIAMFLTGLGGAGTGAVIFYSVAVQHISLRRGTVFGVLAALFTARLNLSALAYDTPSVVLTLIVAAAVFLAAAFLLYRYLPKLLPVTAVNTFVDSPKLTDLPGFWKTTIALGLIFAVSQSINSTSTIYQSWTLYEQDSTNFTLLIAGLKVATALGALVFGIASDRMPAQRLLLLAALLAAPATALSLLPGASATSVAAYAILAFVKGAFIVLPWILLAERLPLNRFATLGVGFTFVGGVLGTLPAPLLVSLTLGVWGTSGPATILIVLSLLAIAVAWRFPRPAPVPLPAD